MIHFRDNNLINVSLAAVSICIALVWLFLGWEISNHIFSEEYRELFYIFISGSMFTLAAISAFFFVKTVLTYAEFIIQKENLPFLLYRSVLEEDSEGVFFKDRNGRYRIINQIARNLLDLNNRTVVGEKDVNLHSSVLAHKIQLEDRKVLKNGETIEWETEKVTSCGNEAYLCKKIPCRDRKGKIIGITGLCKNITILKSFQNLNYDLENRYKNLFNKLPYPVLVLDALSMMPFTFNNAMCELLEYDRNEFSKIRLSAHVSDDGIDGFRERLSYLLDKKNGEFDLKLKTKNKNNIDVSGYAQTINIEDKLYFHIILNDVTEANKSTNELIRSELKYRSLFEHASDAIIIVDMKTFLINDVNEVAINLLGYGRDDLALMSLFDLDISNDHNVTQENLNNLEIYNQAIYEHIIRSRNGEVFYVDVTAHKVNYGENEVYQYVLRDITKKRKTEHDLQLSEQRYRQMFESNQAIKLVINPALHKIEDANPAAANFYGYSLDEMRGMDLSKINIHSNEKLQGLIQQAKKQKTGFYSCPHKLKNGEIRFVEVRDGTMEIDDDILLYSIIHDVTASKQAEDKLVLASKMLDCSTDAVMVTDKNNHIISVNRSFTEVTGFQHAEVISLKPGVIMMGRDDNLITDKMLQTIEENGYWQGDIWHRLKNGVTRPLRATINVVKDNQDVIINHVISMSPKYSDGDEGVNSENHLSLTGLSGKSFFIDRLQYAIDRCSRSDKQLAVMLIDFDKFSQINKLYGCEAGDVILQAIGKRLKFNVRESDTVAHFSKDDFAILLEDLADVQQAAIVAQKIISTLTESYQVEEKVIQLRVSVGISISPDDGMSVEELLRTAALALNNAQEKEGSHFELTSSEINESTHVWMRIDENLHLALKNDEFIVHYLPQMKIDSEVSIEGVEALIRWKPERHNILMPAEFLPNAEQSGFISAIGFKVIDIALDQLNSWNKQKLNIGKLCLNVSQIQIDIDFSEYLVDKCDLYGFSYERVALDFSESDLINCSSDQLEIIRELQNKGFYICMDDYGNDQGNASITSLLQCPVNAIKVDRRLIEGLINKNNTVDFLKVIISLAKTLNIDVIAEGVETEDQFYQLKELGFERMQGFYFSHSVEADDISSFLDDTKSGKIFNNSQYRVENGT